MTVQSKVRVRQISSIREVVPARWDALADGRSFYLSHAWLRSLEEDHYVRERYLLAERGASLVGALPLYDMDDEPNGLYRAAALGDGRWGDRRWTVAGSRRGYANALLISGQRSDSAAVVQALLEEAAASAAAAGTAGLLWPYLSTVAVEQLTEHCRHVEPLVSAADARLDLPEGRLDGWLGSLAPRRRKEVLRERRRFAEAGYVSSVERLSQCWEQAAALFGQLQGKYGHTAPQDHWRAVLGRQQRHLDDHALVFTCRRDANLVAFSLAYPFGNTLYLRLAGFDYSALAGAYEYFELCFYRPADYAYEQGLTALHLGVEAPEAKVLRGARLKPLWSTAMPLNAPLPSWEQRASDAAWNRARLAQLTITDDDSNGQEPVPRAR